MNSVFLGILGGAIAWHAPVVTVWSSSATRVGTLCVRIFIDVIEAKPDSGSRCRITGCIWRGLAAIESRLNQLYANCSLQLAAGVK